MGVDADKRGVKNITELVSEMGMKVGVVTNVGMNHATPSAFYAHGESRSAYKSLYEQYLTSEVDFAAGATILHRKRDGLKYEDYLNMADLDHQYYSLRKLVIMFLDEYLCKDNYPYHYVMIDMM